MPADYERLRAAANDRAAFDAFKRSCKLIEAKLNVTHVYVIAYLPSGYCENLKMMFDKMLNEKINSPAADGQGDYVIIDYKGSYYRGGRRALARKAHLQSSCQSDGSLRVNANRKLR